MTSPNLPQAELTGRARRMADALRHRGPDDAGAWADATAGVALGHRRLSILDLSPAGHQPMLSNSGRYVIAFNGEIYNHLALRAALAGAGPGPSPDVSPGSGGAPDRLAWRGHSDTETLLAAFERWGIAATLQWTVGMFAIALWDRRERVLHLVRDRMGEKPLYYGWVAGAFGFGSELKALRAYPGFANPVCREALTQYLRFTYVMAPRSIYQDIHKLEPGCWLSISAGAPIAPKPPLRPPAEVPGLRLQRWWSLAAAVERGAQDPLTDETQALEELERTLTVAVSGQSLADVPLGAFLSGGVDSSTIVALLQQQSARPIQTFTVGFAESGFDESPHARAVARHLGTDHHELRFTSAECRETIPGLPFMYDEPFADSSQLPTHLVCRAARARVTVALSGDAGDELFGGYNRYFWGPRIWNRLTWLPLPLRRALGAALEWLPPGGWDALGRPVNALLSAPARVDLLGDKAHKLAARLRTVDNLDDLYRSLVSEWPAPASLVRWPDGDGREPASLLDDPLPLAGLDDAALRMMYRDSQTYLPDDILCKVDRAAMAVGLETRVPLLDHRVVELAWRLPLPMKIRQGQGKWALRQVLYRHVPRGLIERPKAGFGMPVGLWLRGPLRDWAEDLLSEARLRQEGYLHPAPIRQAWREHLSGRRDWTPRLWTVLMLQAWLAAQPSGGMP